MSKTYVFLMSRKKQDLKGSTLNPGARSLGLGGYDYNPSTSNLALNSEGCPPKPARSRNIIFSDEQPNDQRHPLFKSPYERASGVNRSDVNCEDSYSNSLGRYPAHNYENKTRPVSEPPFAKSYGRNAEIDSCANFGNGSSASNRRYTRRTAPSYASSSTGGTSYAPLSPPISETATPTNRNLRPSTFCNKQEPQNVSNGKQGYQVKAKTWSRLSNTSLASVADKDNPGNTPYRVNNFKQLDSESQRSRLQSKSISDLQARSGSRTEINVPIGTSRNKEFSTSTTELQSRFRNSEKRNSRTENENWFQPPQQTASGQYQSMTNLKLKSPERESILDNYERIMTEGINSSCNTSYNDLRVVSTISNVKNPGNDIFLEDALERAQRKIQTDKTRAPPQTIYTESVAREEQIKDSGGEVKGRPVAASRLTSDPWFDDSLPRLIPPSNRLADNTDLTHRNAHTLPRLQSSQMTDREIVNEIQNLERQFGKTRSEMQNIKPQNSYSSAARMQHSSSVVLPRQNDVISRTNSRRPEQQSTTTRMINYDSSREMSNTQSLPRSISDVVQEDLYDYIPNDIMMNNDVMPADSFVQSHSNTRNTTTTRTATTQSAQQQRTVAQKSLTLNSVQRITEKDSSRKLYQNQASISSSRPPPHPGNSATHTRHWETTGSRAPNRTTSQPPYRQPAGEHHSDSIPPSSRSFDQTNWASRPNGSSNTGNSRISTRR